VGWVLPRRTWYCTPQAQYRRQSATSFPAKATIILYLGALGVANLGAAGGALRVARRAE
jgi:hypothetical protein